MSALGDLRRIAHDPRAANVPRPTARQIIEGRLGRKLPPPREMPRDIREAVLGLALHLETLRRKERDDD